MRLALVCSLLQFVACNEQQQSLPERSAEVQQIVQETVPLGGRLLQSPVTTRRATTVNAEWKIEISSAEQDYFDWLKQYLGDGYHVISQNQSVLTLGKTLPGDSYTLEFKNGLGSMIDVHFVAIAD